MKELQDIITAWKQIQERQTAALATLVKVEGSAYRRPGARMLITSDGQQVGTISGGCLESDVVKRSQVVLKTGIPSLVKYDTTSEDDLIWGLGLGCQGVAYILIERLNTEQLNALSVVEQCLSTRQAGAVATVFKTETTTETKKSRERVLLYPDGRMVSSIDNPELEAIVKQNIQSVLQQKKSRSQAYVLTEGIAEVFLEVIVPPINLVIFGAGFDALPVVHFAKALGWYVTVIDPQARIQTKERFQESDRLILGTADESTSQMEFDEQTVAVTMSHNYLYDLEFLQMLSTTPLKYLGILGPKKRTNRLLQDLKAEDCIFPPEQELNSPVGLDIGADNPEEIALSIIAEIQAVIKNRPSGFLKDRNAPIHAEQPRLVSSK
ncbi:XdhC family protein [Pleurocapsa sp. FMAR1]|uniref:XdhC family protein n=1 Tax=Pleurocapsa sp. FMAR1 TaxID=3040204 RepID=UPI0029C8A5C5|nr:XdhC family protein [Pleurocapsa sp. FMAR1]